MRRLRTLYDEADAPCRYQRVAAALEEAVREGLFKPGDALPTQRALAAELKVTTGTATHGYAEAARRGLVAGVTGRGTFVSSTGSDVDVMPPPAPLPPSTQWPDAEAAAPSDGDSSAEPRWNLGFIAPFESLNPSLHKALGNLLRRLSDRELAELQSYHRPAGMDRHREAGALWRGRYGRASLGPRSFGVRRLSARAHDHTRHPVYARRQDSRGKPELSAAARTLLAAASAACARAHRRVRQCCRTRWRAPAAPEA